MKKWLTAIVLLLSIVALSGCNNGKDIKSDTSSHVISKKRIDKSLRIAQQDTDGLFDNDSHTKLLDGTSFNTIEAVEREVNALEDSKEKSKLLSDIKQAKRLWAPFDKAAKKFAAVQPSKKTDEQKKLEADEAAIESSKTAASSSKAASQAASQAASKAKAQADSAVAVIEMVKEMYQRVDGVGGISEKVIALSKRSTDKDYYGYQDDVKKEITVLNNVISECEENTIMSGDLAPSKDELMYKANRFWELTATILKKQKKLLQYKISESDTLPSDKAYTKNADDWDRLYKSITK